jgi:hypothetical protein
VKPEEEWAEWCDRAHFWVSQQEREGGRWKVFQGGWLSSFGQMSIKAIFGGGIGV